MKVLVKLPKVAVAGGRDRGDLRRLHSLVARATMVACIVLLAGLLVAAGEATGMEEMREVEDVLDVSDDRATRVDNTTKKDDGNVAVGGRMEAVATGNSSVPRGRSLLVILSKPGLFTNHLHSLFHLK